MTENEHTTPWTRPKLTTEELQSLREVTAEKDMAVMEVGRRYLLALEAAGAVSVAEQRRMGLLGAVGKKYGLPENEQWLITKDGEIHCQALEDARQLDLKIELPQDVS